MSFFSKKQETKLEEFCKEFYQRSLLNPTVGKVNVAEVFPEYIKKNITEVDPVFEKVELPKLENEIVSMRFELFALAWLHDFGIGSAINQSIYTKAFLKENGKIDIWNGMEHYNKGIASSIIVDVSEREKARIIKMRADIADKYFAIADKKGIVADETFGWPINRLESNSSWKQRKTAYFIMLGLCHKLGLGYGRDYFGPNKEAQIRLMTFIDGFYEGAKQSWADVKIIN